MSKMIDPVNILRERLSQIGESIYREQEQMIGPMFEALQRKGTVFVGQGPPGMGKTYVIAAVTKGLVEKKKRVCIAVPSYTHLKEVMGRHLKDLGIDYVVLRGLSALEKHEGCPLKNMELPSPIFCSDRANATTGPGSKTCSDIECTVKRERREVESANVVMTVFHKLLSNPKYLDEFDVVVFDESHGLEPVVRSARVVRVRREDLAVLSEFAPEYKDAFEEVASSFNELRKLKKADIPLRFVERRIVDRLENILPAIEAKAREIEESGGSYDQEVVNAFYKLQAAIDAFKKPGMFRFVHHNGVVLGIPHKVTFSPPYAMRRGKETAVSLISATIETPKFHAKDSGFPDHTLAPPVQVKTVEFMERYRKRPILGLVDGPILRKDPQRLDEYDLARKEANAIIGSILPSFNHPVLILCRSHSDAYSVQSYLRTIREIRNRLYLFNEEEGFGEIDEIETKVNREIASGRNIILTSASSRLWEGVNLKGLRMLVVDALPYASPQPYDRFEDEAWGSWRTSRTFRFMIRRIQQGVGRLIRTKKDPWGGSRSDRRSI